MKTKATATDMGKRTRITLDLSDRSYRRLNALAELVEADSKASVMRQALQCFEYIAKLSHEGSEFWVRHPDGRKEKLLFFLPASDEASDDKQPDDQEGAFAAITR